MRTVMFLDGRTGEWSRVADIEVPPGSRRLDDAECEAWYLPTENWGSLFADPVQRADYDAAIATIGRTFAQFYPLNQSQWWEVIEGDRNPIESFARWYRAAEVYREFASVIPRYELYNLLSTLVRFRLPNRLEDFS